MPSNKPYVDSLSQFLPQTTSNTVPVPTVDYFTLQKELNASSIEASKSVLAQTIEAKKRDQQSWVSQLNLSPDSVLGTSVNMSASLLSGAANMGGIVAALPLYTQGLDDINFADEDFRAAERLNKGTASKEDLTRLNRKAFTLGDETILDVIQKSSIARDSAKDVRDRFNLNGIVHQGDRTKLSTSIKGSTADDLAQVQQGWDQLKNYEELSGWGNIVSGAGKALAHGAGALWDNPKATTEYTFENIPQIVAGGPGGTVGKVALGGFTGGYALDTYNEGIKQKIKDNDGQMPSQEERLGSLAWGLTAGAAEYASNVFLGAKAAHGLPGLATESVSSGFKNALKTAALDVAASMGEEGLTEGFQTFAEDAAAGKSADLGKILESGLIGAAVGGHISGLASVKDVASAAMPKGSKDDGSSIGPSDEFLQAVQAKDPSVLMKSGNVASYTEAVKAAHHLLLNEQGATQEQKDAWQSTSDKAMSLLEHQLTKAQGLLDPAKHQAAVADLKSTEDMLAATDPANTQEIDTLNSIKEIQQRFVNEFDKANQDPEATKEHIKAVSSLLEEAKAVYAESAAALAAEKSAAKPIANIKEVIADANINVASADEATKAKATEAVKSLVLSMISDNKMSSAEVRALASNKANALTDTQRDYFERFAEAMDAVGRVKTLGKVANEVLYGDQALNQKGLMQYQELIGKFLASGKKAAALRELAGLQKFASGHNTKASALNVAYDKAQNTGGNYQVVKQNGAWSVEPLKLSPEKLAELGGFNVHPGSTKLIEHVNTEVDALKKAHQALKAAAELDMSASTQPAASAPAAEVKPVAKEPMSEKDLAVSQLEKQRRKVERENPKSLYSVLRNKLNDTDLNDIYGSEWKKRYTTLKGKQARSLVDMVTDGLLNDYLPADLHFGSGLDQGLEQEQKAVEYIKDRLRNQDYLTEATNMALARLDLTIDAITQTFTSEEIDENLAQATSLVTSQEQAGDVGSDQNSVPTATSGSVVSGEAAQAGTEPNTESQPGSEPVAPVTPENANGILDVLKDGASFLAGRIVQKLKGDSTAQRNPLVAVKDFLSAWKAGEVDPKDFLKDELDDKQITALNNFKDFADAMSKAIPGILRASPEFKYARKNPAEFLMTRENGKLDLPENVKTAIAMATMTWMADAIRSSAYNGKKEINQILGRDEDSALTDKMIDVLADAGARRSVIANEIGKQIVQALGMSASTKAEKSLMPRLESTLGALAVGFMVRNGLVTEKKISGAEFSQLTGSDSAAQYFIRAAFDTRTKDWAPQIKAIAEPLIGTKNVLEKLFSVDAGLRAPSLEPQAFTQDKAKKSSMKVPKWLASQLDKEAKNPYQLDTDSFHLLASMSEDTVVGLQGAFNGEEGARHKANRKGLQAKKDGLLREWRNLIEFVSNDLATSDKGTQSPFYFMPSVWKNQRVGLANNLVNPQTSKIQRGLMYQDSWKTEIDPSNPDSLNAFKLRVLEKFGVKIEKAATDKVLTEWDGKVSQPEIKAAVAALSSWLDTKEMTPAIEQAIATGVAKAGEGMGSFNALMALAQMERANGGKFTTTLTAEIDGVANGPMLSMLLLGAAASKEALTSMLNLGGFFEQGKGIKNYNIFRGMPGVQDLYETAGSKLMDVLSTAPARAEIDSLWYFLGQMTKDGKVTSAGRKIIKTPITALIFGSSMTTATNNMVDDLVNGMYSAIEEVAAGKKDNTEVIQHINAFLPGNNKWPASLSVEEMMSRMFTSSDLRAISGTFDAVLGKHVKVALDPIFGSLTERRDTINKTAAVNFGLYSTVKGVLEKQMREHLVSNGKAQANSNGTPVWDLTSEQEKIIQRMLKGIEPLIHTVMSKTENGLDAGVLLAKQATKQSDSELYHSTVQFSESKFDGSMGIYSQTRVISEPGTMVLPTQAHSFDSGVSHFAVDTHSLNVHDARITGVNGALDVAQKMNQGVWENALQYSPVSEVYDSLARSISGLVKLLGTQEKNLPEGQVPVMLRVLAPAVMDYLVEYAKKAKIKPGNDGLATAKIVLTRMLSDAKYQAYQADSLRLGVMSEMQAIDQYAAEGGQYDVTSADRAKAKEKLDALSMGVDAAVLADVDALIGLLAQAKGQKGNTTSDVSSLVFAEAQGMAADLGLSDSQIIRIMHAASSAATETIRKGLDGVLSLIDSGMVLADALSDSLSHTEAQALMDFIKGKVDSGVQGRYGVLGKPSMAPIASLAAFFEASPITTGKALAEHLNGYLKALPDNKVAQAYRQMLLMAARTMSADTKVVYVTPETDPSLVKSVPESASRGWYSPSDKTLYVLSPDHIESGLDTEVLIHELTHAALHDVVDSPKTTVQKELVESLTSLMGAAKEAFADKAQGNPVFAQALNNIHEFIAYGLTNRAFQKEVLGQMKVQSTDKLKSLISGLQDFLTKLAGLLFNKKLDHQSDEVDGFTAMVANVTGLYQDLAKQGQAKVEWQVNKPVLSMVSGNSTTASTVMEFSTHQVFDALAAPGVSAAFVQKLDGLLTKVVNSIHGPFGALKTQIQSQIGNTPLEAWSHALISGQRPFASKALNSGVLFSQKEAFVTEQIEATVRQFMDDKSAASSLIYREISNLYQQAKEALKGKIAADTYAYVFQAQGGTGHSRSDYLSKFVALGLANEDFNKALAFETHRPHFMASGLPFMERLEEAWKGLIDWVSARWTGTRMGQQADVKLELLVSQLVQVETRYKFQVPGVNILHDFLERATASGDVLAKGARDKIGDIAESDFFTKSSYGPVRMAGAIASISARGRAEGVMETISKIRNKHFKEADGLAMGILSYVRGPGKWANALLMGTKRVEQQRQAIISDTSKIILDSFANAGAALTKQAKAGISYVFLRTGAHALLGHFDMAGIQELLDSSQSLDLEIQDHQQMLRQYSAAEYYIKQAHGLGFYLATNKVGMHGQNTNSLSISKLFGTGSNTPPYAEAAAPIIERLAALHALKELGRDAFGKEHLKHAAEVLRQENQRGDANGIEMSLLTHKHFEQDARERLFSGGNESLMVQGYLPEVSNPHTSFVVVRDPAEAQELSDKGYEYVHEVALDDVDPDRRPAKMMILRGGGLGRRQSGVFSLTDIGAKGEAKHNKYYDPNTSQGVENMQSMFAIQSAVDQSIRDQFSAQPGFDPRAAAQTNDFMLPLFNAQGQIVDYRYVMSARNRDTMLERDNRFEHLLGVSAGTTFDKQTSREQNHTALTALKDHYNANFSHSSSDFIRVSHNSPDARMREIWDMLPDKTKRDVRTVWGSNGLWVPKNMVDVMFGYRKYSLAEAFDKAHPNMFEKFFMDGMTRILFDYARIGKGKSRVEALRYAKRGAITTRKAEALWQELVHEAKDFIVIKGIKVARDNMLSNTMLLMGKGVPMVQAFKDMFIAWRAAVEYDQNVHALRKLELLVETGYGSHSMDEVKGKIAELQDALARNPVTELVEAGLKPTIVEDVGMEDNPYSYKSQLTQWVEEKTKGVTPGLMRAGKFVYMTHDTALYKFLNKTTQYSDFVARYALYKHQTERAKVRMSKEDALFDAAESFVMYDIPMPKALQYLDDMGLMPFIKYYLSIQRVLGRMLKDKPLATLNMIVTGNMLGNLPVPTDSSFTTRIGNNPFSAGIFELPGAMTEAATVQSSLALIK